MTDSSAHPFVARNYRSEEDFASLLELRRILEDETMSEAVLLAELAAPNQEPALDLWVVESADGASLLGYSIGYHTVPERYLIWGGVRQAWRRRGIGSDLLAHSIERARTLGAEHILINVVSDDEGTALFLQHHEFWPKSHIWLMSALADTPLSEVELPQGYRIQSFAETQDFQVLYDAYFGSCHDLWGHGANSKKRAAIVRPIANDWAEWFSDDDPEGEGLFFVFAANGEVAGLCRGRPAPLEARESGAAIGYIDALGVAPEVRPLALERPLTLAVAHWLRSRGHGLLKLEIYGIDEEKVKLYKGLGFAIDLHIVAYHLDL